MGVMITERCYTCGYCGELMYKEPCCDYILYTGHRRGCPSGDACIKYTHITKEMKQRKRDLDLVEYICN